MTDVSQPETAAQPGSSRPRRFLIARDSSIHPANVGPVDFDWIIEQLEEAPDINVVHHLEPRSFRAQNLGNSVTDRVVVATMSDEAAEELVQHPQVIVEEDSLILPQPAIMDTALVDIDPGLLSPFGVSTSWTLKLVGDGGQPVGGATVYLYGSGVPVQGRTDAQGTVTLSLRNETDATLRALYVNPLSDYWSMWQNRPNLISGTTNTVRLQPLSGSFPGFPSTEILGWGQQAMRLDQVPAALTGRGVKVAVVDSGAAALTHPDLSGIHEGVDLTNDAQNDTQWRDDTIAHGSHCSGIIAGARNGGGIRGFAPDAEIYEARIFPGGRISSLLDAIDYCIDEGIDVVNMSLGTGGTSQIMLERLSQAKDLGVACIVAAGNTGGGVQFPGTSPDVLTVAAIGQEGAFPEASYHAQQRWTSGTSVQGYFSAQFSCHGAEVDVCGPGVAVVSSVPPTGYAAWDGTSMATPHVAGLAALVLAHHPDFQVDGMNLPVAARVDHLFEILKNSATSLNFGDPQRSGSGLPDAPRALGLTDSPTQVNLQETQATAIKTALAQLAQEMVNAGLLAETLAVDPSFVARITDFELGSFGRTMRFKRELAELAARMRNVGLPTTPAPSVAASEPSPVV
jgi:subtilisin family serine protease